MKTKMQRHIETITNGSDQVLKFPDGTLIISGKRDFRNLEFYQESNMYRTIISDEINFVVPFINSPAVCISTGSTVDYDYASVIGMIKDAIGIKQIALERSSIPKTNYVGIQFIAIGKWK